MRKKAQGEDSDLIARLLKELGKLYEQVTDFRCTVDGQIHSEADWKNPLPNHLLRRLAESVITEVREFLDVVESTPPPIHQPTGRLRESRLLKKGVEFYFSGNHQVVNHEHLVIELQIVEDQLRTYRSAWVEQKQSPKRKNEGALSLGPPAEQPELRPVATRYVSPREYAEIMGVAESTLAVWRSQGRKYPRFIKVGRQIRYVLSEE